MKCQYLIRKFYKEVERVKKIDFEMSVRKALRIKKISLSKMAKELGISTAYCSDLVRGNRESEERKKQIKEFLEI